jgi:CRP-like cAMP-binding protein
MNTSIINNNPFVDKMSTQLREAINKYMSFSASEWEDIARHFTAKTVAKNEFLIKPGQVAKDLSFVTQGGFRIYSINSEGKEVVSWLAFEGQFISEYVSFFSGDTSPEYIQALEDVELLSISKKRMAYLYGQYPKWNLFGRLLAEEMLVYVKQYVFSLIKESAEERYKKLLERNPQLLQRVPLKHIASFIGVTDTSLSRIRRNVTHSH